MSYYYQDKHYRRRSSSSSSSSDDEKKRWKKEKKRQEKMMKHGGGGYGGMNVHAQLAGQPQYPYPGGGMPMTGYPVAPQSVYMAGGPAGGPGYPTGGGGAGYPTAGGMPQPGGGPAIGFNVEGQGANYGMQPPGGPGYGMPPQGGPGYGMPPQGGPGYGMPPQGGPGYGMPPQGMPPQGGPGYGMPPQGMPPQGGPGYGMPPQGMPPQGGPGYGMPPQGMPPQGGPGYGPPGGMPQQAPGYNPQGQPKGPPARPPPPVAVGGGVYKGLQGRGGAATDLANILSGLCIGPGGEQYSGTVRPEPNFNPESDCEKLRTAMRGAGTDEKALIDVTARRSAEQRQAVKRMYKTMYGKDLLSDLKSELSGNFENLMIALFADPEYYDALCLRNSMKGAGTREGVLIEIMCTRTNQQIEAIKLRYKKEFNRDLEKDIVSETSGQFKRLLVSCCQANRSELTPEQYETLRSQGVSAVLNYQQVEKDANDLFEAGAKRWGTDESVFLRIMATRNIYHLRAVFDAYAKKHGKDIISVIESEMSGDTESGYKAVARTVINRPAYFAHALHKSMAGLGTNDSALIRIVVTRSEIDLRDIKAQYMVMYKTKLASDIKGDTSGDYKRCLLAIVGE